MKKRIARALRWTARRLDPQPSDVPVRVLVELVNGDLGKLVARRRTPSFGSVYRA
jgi:hypothetical protein